MLLVFNWDNHFKLCIKKKQQTKNNKRKLCVKPWILAHQIWLNQKKSKNTTKCHNIFIIPLFLAVVSFNLIFYYLCGGTNLSLRRYCPLWEWAEEADATRTNLLNPILGRDVSHLQLISMSSQVGCTHQFIVSI